jgi:DNA-3-methyladenine glycosylase II
MHRLTEETYQTAIDEIAHQNSDVQKILERFGYPPFWHREPGFRTLARTICEQLLSLAAAKTIFGRLESLLDTFSPESLLQKSDDELRSCGLSRQKIGTLKRLATAILDKSLDLAKLKEMKDPNEVRDTLTKLKGIGPWTAESYMILSLHHADVFPLGDVAAVNALKLNELIESDVKKPEVKRYVNQFAPNRTALTLLMWHSYIQRKEITFEP